jgi:uncharacterized protein with GYD domain
MPTYITLLKYTDQGIRNIRDTAKRATAFKDMAAKGGVTVREIFWTMGRYDLVAIIEAADESATLAVLLGVGSMGNVKTETLRAYSASEIERTLEKLPKA